MDENVEYDILEDALKRCHSNWDAAQSHGLLTGRLAVAGVPAGPDWMLQVLEDSDAISGTFSLVRRVPAWPRFRNAWRSAQRATVR